MTDNVTARKHGRLCRVDVDDLFCTRVFVARLKAILRACCAHLRFSSSVQPLTLLILVSY